MRPFNQKQEMRRPRQLLMAAVLLTLCACSTLPDAERTDARDPFEVTNRDVFEFNMAIDSVAIEPLADVYRKSLPERGKLALENHLNWASLPATTLNSALQGRFENAGLSLLHFAVNGLTFGLADLDRKSTRLNSSHSQQSRMPSSA